MSTLSFLEKQREMRDWERKGAGCLLIGVWSRRLLEMLASSDVQDFEVATVTPVSYSHGSVQGRDNMNARGFRYEILTFWYNCLDLIEHTTLRVGL